MLDLPAQIEEAAAFVRERWPQRPHVGIMLGSGLGGIADRIERATAIDYASIPGFPATTALGHRGRLVCGQLCDVSVTAMQGRFHAYEGYSAAALTVPIRVMKALGANLLIVSNASGGLNHNYRSGDIMAIDDHINLMGINPLVGINDGRLGPRFPDMSSPYDSQLNETVMRSARRKGFVVHRGVYAAMRGPNYETRSEYRFLRRIGADVVGMSTVPEVIVAVHAGMRVLGLSVVANICRPDALQETSGAEVVAVVQSAAARLQEIVLDVLTNERRG